MAKVFISYARQERRWAEWLDEGLRRFGHTVWWDRDLVAGDQFAAAIRSELDRADAVVVLWSEASWRSSWVQAEALAAHDVEKLISTRIDGIRPGVPFNANHCIDLDLNSEADFALSSVVRAVNSLTTRASSSPDMSSWIDEQFENLPRGTAILTLTSRPELLRNGSWDRSQSKVALEYQALNEHDPMALVWLADILWARAMPNDRFRARTIGARVATDYTGMAGDFAANRLEKWQ